MYLGSLENLIWSFIKSSLLCTVINLFCNFFFLLSSFLTIYNSIPTFIFQLFILVSVQAKSLSSIFPYFYFDLFYSLSEYSFIRLLFRDTPHFLLIASNLPHLLTSFYPSNYLFYSPRISVYTISIRIFCISSFYSSHKLQWYSS